MEIKLRCFYRDKMYPVKSMQFYDDGSYSVSIIEMEVDEEIRDVSPDSEHIKGVMPYIGEKDMKGKEIYLGDIVYEKCYTHRNHLIVFKNASFGTEDDRKYFGNLLEDYDAEDLLVIGNIYENKELLDRKDPYYHPDCFPGM